MPAEQVGAFAGEPDWKTGAGNETRTRDPDLGKVVLYQLSYSRVLFFLEVQMYIFFHFTKII